MDLMSCPNQLCKAHPSRNMKKGKPILMIKLWISKVKGVKKSPSWENSRNQFQMKKCKEKSLDREKPLATRLPA